MTARPAHILRNRIHLHGVWPGVLLVQCWCQRSAELARGHEGVGLDELRQLHKEHQRRFIRRPDHVRVMITAPSAPVRF